MIQHVILISLAITGIHICCRDGMVFERPRVWVQNILDWALGYKASAYVQKPLFSCLMCMSSIWGLIGCLVLNIPACDWIFTILSVCGLNAIITFFLRRE
jgi:hypothetical protein